MPTVASFVPSIPLGSPFKVSIHSWEPPVTSPDTQALAGEADKIFFEARVLVDGVTVAYATVILSVDELLMQLAGVSFSISSPLGRKSSVCETSTVA